MKPLKILFILIIIYSIGKERVKAQVPQSPSYQTTNQIKSNPAGNWDTTYGKGYASGLYRTNAGVPFLPAITAKTIFDTMSIDGNNYDFINKPILLNYEMIRSLDKTTYMNNYGYSGTFNGKWEKLTGKPIFDTLNVYYYPLKIRNTPTPSDNYLYRMTGTIFNILMDVKYPYRNAPK